MNQNTNFNPAHEAQLKRVRWLSRILDNSIKVPGSEFRIGLDPLIGLIPGVGDLISSTLSGYIIVMAVSANVSAWTLTRMTINVLIESVVGMIPFVGDIFDAVWKANERNRRLLESALQSPQRKKLDRRFVVLIFIALAGGLVLTTWVAIQTIAWLIRLASSYN